MPDTCRSCGAPVRFVPSAATGRLMCLTDWAAVIGIKPNTLLKRIRSGMNVADALSLPLNSSQQRSHP